jgi:hypothetical protein
LNGPVWQILLVARFLCFMSVLYLALHNVVCRFSRRPDSKLLWFFGMLTAPLTHPIRLWLMPGATDNRVLPVTLLVYVLLWLFVVVLEHWLAASLH